MSSDDLDLDYNNNNINNLVRAARSWPSHDELTNARRHLRVSSERPDQPHSAVTSAAFESDDVT